MLQNLGFANHHPIGLKLHFVKRSPEYLSDCIDAVYGAAEQPALWPDFIAHLARAIGGQSNALVVHSTRRAMARRIQHGWDVSSVRAYEAHFARINPWIPRVPASFEPGVVVSSEEFLSASVLVKTEFYQDFGRKHG